MLVHHVDGLAMLREMNKGADEMDRKSHAAKKSAKTSGDGRYL